MTSPATHNVRRALLGVTLAPLFLLLTVANWGCGNAAANTAVALLGVGVGAQAATGTNVEVIVDVYDPGQSDLTAGQALALHDVTTSASHRTAVDPVEHPTAPVLRQIATKLAPLVDQLQGTTTTLRVNAKKLIDAGERFGEVGNAFDRIAQRQDDVVGAWERYRAAIRAIPSDPNPDLSDAARMLAALRAAFRSMATERLSDATLALLRTDIIQVAQREFESAKVTNADQLRAALVQALGAASADPNAGAGEQVQALIYATIRALAPEPQVAKTAVAQVQSLFGGSVAELAARAQADAQIAYTITFGLLTSTPNFGPIANEVTQFLMSPGTTIARIARGEEEGRWRHFSRASVRGGPGNQDAILYMENAGFPMLKTSTFDPTKFVVANGKLYQQAFSVLTEALLPSDTAASGAGDSGKGAAGTEKSAAGTSASGGGGGGKTPTAPTAAGAARKAKKSATANDGGPKKSDAQAQIAKIRAAELEALKAVLATDAETQKHRAAVGEWASAAAGKQAIELVQKALKNGAASVSAIAKPAP